MLSKATLLIFAIAALSTAVMAQGTAFTYQGTLKDGAFPASGSYDFQFALFDAQNNGNQVGLDVFKTSVTLTGGAFTVVLDFGNQFTGADRFLEIHVKKSTDSSYTLLNGRQKITPAPYAINAAQLGGAAASQYVLTNDSRLSDARPPTCCGNNYIQNLLNLPGTQSAGININGDVTIGGTFTGNGSGLTNVSAVTASAIQIASSDPTSPIAGQVYYNTTSPSLKVWDGSSWQVFPTAGFIQAYDINNQNLIAPNTFQTINFFNTTLFGGWTHNGPTTFICPANGFYMVQYTVEASFSSSSQGTMIVKAQNNSVDIAASQLFAIQNAAGLVPFSHTFMSSMNAGDVLSLQFTGSGTATGITASGSMPSATISITRIR